MHLLLKLVRLLQNNVKFSKRLRLKEIEAVKLERELTMKKGLNLLYKNKLNGDVLEQKLQDHLLRKNRKLIESLFSHLLQSSLKRQDKKLKIGMAIVKRDSALQK
jgi:hypothetical protein